jgi:hypothetical protein
MHDNTHGFQRHMSVASCGHQQLDGGKQQQHPHRQVHLLQLFSLANVVQHQASQAQSSAARGPGAQGSCVG